MAAALQITGSAFISIGAWLMFPPAGIALAGAFMIAFGLTIELNKRRD